MTMQRTGSILLCFVLAGAPAAAAVTEIPARYLEHEARLRGALSPQERARVDALTARLTVKMSVVDVKAMIGSDSASSLFLVMLQYLKLLNKEARDDHKIARSDAASELRMKASKIDLEKEKIEKQKEEAAERYRRAMEAADLETWMSLTSTGAAAAVSGNSVGAASGAKVSPTKTPVPAPRPSIGVRAQ
jgi:hypothetical protein